MFNYVKRSSTIKNADGSLVFHMDDVEVPDFWTQVATDILAQKYFRKAGVPLRDEEGELLLDESGKVITGSETSIKQVAANNYILQEESNTIGRRIMLEAKFKIGKI